MGAPKALLVVAGEPLVDRGVRSLAQGGCDPIVVVLGAASRQVLATAGLRGATPVVNRRWSEGQGSSLRAGLAELEASGPEVAACVVQLVDTPGIGPEAVRRVARASLAAGPETAAVATYGGRRGHPVALGRALWPAVAERATGDTGARALLADRPDVVLEVPCDDLAAADDLDTPEDFAAFVAATGTAARGAAGERGEHGDTPGGPGPSMAGLGPEGQQ